MELSQAIASAEREFEAAELRLAAAQAEVDELAALYGALRAAAGRFDPAGEAAPRPAQPQGPGPENWRPLSRTEAVRQAIRQSDAALSPSEIAAVLRDHGRSDSADEVSGALSYLRRTHWAETVSYGKWRRCPLYEWEGALVNVKDDEWVARELVDYAPEWQKDRQGSG